MDRIVHPTTVDIGGGRRGFRSKDTVAGVPGTVVTATHLNAEQEELLAVIEKSGLVPDNATFNQVAKAMRSQKMNFFTATGSVNALTITPDPAFGNLASLAGVPLRIYNGIATNTGPLTLNVNGLGAQPVIGFRGGAMAGGDWPNPSILEVIWNGSAFQSLTYLPSDALTMPFLGFSGDAVSQSFPVGAVTKVAAYTNIRNGLPGATYSAGVITIATTGEYLFGVNMDALFATGANYSWAVTVSRINVSELPILSIASMPATVSTASMPNTMAGSPTGMRSLVAGDRIAAFVGQNSAAAQPMSIALKCYFMGVL